MSDACICPTCDATVLSTDETCWSCGLSLALSIFRPLTRA